MMRTPAQDSLPARAYALVRLLVFAGILGYLAWQIGAGWDAVRGLRIDWQPAGLVLSALCGLVAYQGLPVAWLMLLRRTGIYRSGQLPGYARAWWQSFLYRYVPGKVLLVVERARLGAALGVPPAAGAMLTIVETLLSVLAGSAVSLLSVFYYAGADTAWMPVATVFLFPPGYRLISRLPAIRRRYPELQSIAMRWQDIIAVTVPYVGYYLLLGLALFLVSRSVTPLPWSALPGLCGIYALSHVISLVAVLAPAGLGVREGALAVQLGQVVPQGIAGMLAIVARLWFTLIELLSFGLVLAIARLADGRRRAG